MRVGHGRLSFAAIGSGSGSILNFGGVYSMLKSVYTSGQITTIPNASRYFHPQRWPTSGKRRYILPRYVSIESYNLETQKCHFRTWIWYSASSFSFFSWLLHQAGCFLAKILRREKITVSDIHYCKLMLHCKRVPAESIMELKQIITLQSTLLCVRANFVISVSLTPFSQKVRYFHLFGITWILVG